LSHQIRHSVLLIPFVTFFTALVFGQTSSFANVTKGRMEGSQYVNDFFHVVVEVPQPTDSLRLNTIVHADSVQLVMAVKSEGPIDERFMFSVIAKSMERPDSFTTEQFVRSVRHNLEREGMQTLVSEKGVVISGQTFILSKLKFESNEVHYYKAVLATIRNGAVLGFWIEAADEGSLDKLLALEGKLRFIKN
jgi:hypothetical protein